MLLPRYSMLACVVQVGAESIGMRSAWVTFQAMVCVVDVCVVWVVAMGCPGQVACDFEVQLLHEMLLDLFVVILMRYIISWVGY